MKLSKLFHWLYASLMFLPLLIIPVFAIYTRNESNTFENNIELQVEQNKVVDFNQIAYDGNFSNLNNFSLGHNLIVTYVNNGISLRPNDSTISGFRYITSNNFVDYLENTYLVRFDYSFTSNTNYLYFRLLDNTNTPRYSKSFVSSNSIVTSEYIFTLDNTYDLKYQFVFDGIDLTYLANVNIFNLTQMFGDGNEPTITQFNQWYSNDYYDYTLSENQLLKNYSVETLNNTDIGSQFLYSVYKPVNDYFNIKDWMNLGGLYDWFLLNIFNGSNSIVIPIIFNLIIYWLVVSFIWLIFDVLMYVPNMIHKMLDKARME